MNRQEYIYLSIDLSIYLCIYLHISIYLFICVCLSVWCLSACLPAYLPTCLSVCLSLSVYLSMYSCCSKLELRASVKRKAAALCRYINYSFGTRWRLIISFTFSPLYFLYPLYETVGLTQWQRGKGNIPPFAGNMALFAQPAVSPWAILA
jgi:hypothetical protein